MEKEYVIQIAQTIQEQLIGLTPMPVLMSWGIAEFAATIFKDLPALRIKVNGLLHTGYVIIALNGSDYYEVYLLKGKDAECVNEEVCYNELGDVIDRAIECGTDKEEYEKMAQAKNPFGDGQASRRIVESILYAFGKKADRPDEYVLRIKYEKTPKEGKPMKEERMAILNMLEKGIISVDEAERLLTALHSGLGTEKDGITKAVGGMLNKAGAALSAVADKVKENPAVKNAADKVADKADDLQPKVSSAAFRMKEKLADKADELQPAVRSAAFRMAEKASEIKEDMATYREKLREKRNRDEAEDWDDIDLEELDAAEAPTTEEAPEAAEAAPAEGEEAVEPISPEMNKYLNKVEDVLDGMSDQMEQLNDMEAFLKASFGEYDPADFEDDEEEPTDEKKDAE